jgi:hypothetical protein
MQKATGITRPVKGREKGAENWVELWVGDVIKCRVYITDRAGCYLWIDEAIVFWEADYGQYSIRAKYHQDGKDCEGVFALRDVLRRDMEFITKVRRDNGTTNDVILDIITTLRSYYKEPMELNDIKAEIEDVDDSAREQAIIDTVTEKLMVEMASYITDMGIVPHTEIYEAFNKE